MRFNCWRCFISSRGQGRRDAEVKLDATGWGSTISWNSKRGWSATRYDFKQEAEILLEIKDQLYSEVKEEDEVQQEAAFKVETEVQDEVKDRVQLEATGVHLDTEVKLPGSSRGRGSTEAEVELEWG